MGSNNEATEVLFSSGTLNVVMQYALSHIGMCEDPEFTKFALSLNWWLVYFILFFF
jgi:hypothetical protein